MNRKTLAIIGCSVLLALGGCAKKATGQVVAVVNGEEISLSDLNAELKGVDPASAGDKKALANAALQRIIDRKLMVQRAKERGLDKDPEYLQQQRRVNDELLIGLLGKQVSGNVGVPTAAAVDKFMADNPAMFGQRAVYKVDQIQFPLPQDRAPLKALEADKTLDAIGGHLTKLNIKFQRGAAQIDSATTPPELLQKILGLPPGEPFILAVGGKVFVSVIVGKQAIAMPPEAARPLAADAMRRRDLGELATKQLKEAKAAAKIEYQPGYSAPPADGKPATTK